MASHNPFAWVTLAHLRTQQARHDPDQLYAAKWQLTTLLYEHGWSNRRIIVLFKVINWMMTLPAPQQGHYWRGVFQLRKEHKMELNMRRPLEWVTPLEEMFMEKGRQEGAAALLQRQLARRFGPLSQTNRKKLAKASLEQLEAWSDALPEAQSLKQVFG
jgi:hypothetical protein